MLLMLEAHARKAGWKLLRLDTIATQIAAQHLYPKYGYQETGRKPWRDTEIVFFEKVLSSPPEGSEATTPRRMAGPGQSSE